MVDRPIIMDGAMGTELIKLGVDCPLPIWSADANLDYPHKVKEIHSNLFLQNNMKIDLPSLGIGEFFRDFEENIYTKIILLVFIAYVVTQFIRLFTVNLNLSGGK